MSKRKLTIDDHLWQKVLKNKITQGLAWKVEQAAQMEGASREIVKMLVEKWAELTSARLYFPDLKDVFTPEAVFCIEYAFRQLVDGDGHMRGDDETGLARRVYDVLSDISNVAVRHGLPDDQLKFKYNNRVNRWSELLEVLPLFDEKEAKDMRLSVNKKRFTLPDSKIAESEIRHLRRKGGRMEARVHKAGHDMEYLLVTLDGNGAESYNARKKVDIILGKLSDLSGVAYPSLLRTSRDPDYKEARLLFLDMLFVRHRISLKIRSGEKISREERTRHNRIEKLFLQFEKWLAEALKTQPANVPNLAKPRASTLAQTHKPAAREQAAKVGTKIFTATEDIPRDGISKGDKVIVELTGGCPNAHVGAVKMRHYGLRIARIYRPDPDHVRIGEDYQDIERNDWVTIIGPVVEIIKPPLPPDDDGILDADTIG